MLPTFGAEGRFGNEPYIHSRARQRGSAAAVRRRDIADCGQQVLSRSQGRLRPAARLDFGRGRQPHHGADASSWRRGRQLWQPAAHGRHARERLTQGLRLPDDCGHPVRLHVRLSPRRIRRRILRERLQALLRGVQHRRVSPTSPPSRTIWTRCSAPCARRRPNPAVSASSTPAYPSTKKSKTAAPNGTILHTEVIGWFEEICNEYEIPHLRTY